MGAGSILTKVKSAVTGRNGWNGSGNGVGMPFKSGASSASKDGGARRSQSGTATGPVAKQRDFSAWPVFRQLPAELQEQAMAHDHLWGYLRDLPIEDIGVPNYYPRLDPTLSNLEYRNLIYPVGQSVFIHVYPDMQDSRDLYFAIEPSLAPSVPELMTKVDQQLINYVEELKKAADADARARILLQTLDRIVHIRGSGEKAQPNAVEVTEEELQGLKYLMLRDKEGLGTLQPLINDPNLEDISCSGVGPLFVEHRIFGGLKATISFYDNKALNDFVIRLSEKIGRPVTVREPVVDATLPDGSRINIVYGEDVSRRGSNFTIRKFTEIPFSILDLIATGSLSYEMAAYISLMLGAGMNTFVSGETASGKTTMLNAITTFIDPNAKIVSIEDTPELQVPHQNWIREVTRGSASGGASVTMFDLLRAALRQRPNEIIIGEIRGEEGAIAFQAMQTGHACMATFHAASVEKLIQRLTGNPINVPKTYVDNLNMVIIMSAVRLPSGKTGRRVLSLNEIIEYSPESNSFAFIEVFRWDPATDTFEYPGYMNTNILEHVVGVRRGIPPHESRQIYQELEDRANILRSLKERNVGNFYELHAVLSKAHREGLFR